MGSRKRQVLQTAENGSVYNKLKLSKSIETPANKKKLILKKIFTLPKKMFQFFFIRQNPFERKWQMPDTIE